MFAYCKNGPTIRTDEDGHFGLLTCIIVGAVVGAVVGGCIGAAESKKQTGEVKPLAVIGGAIGGGVIGGLIGWGLGILATAAPAAAGSVAAGGGTLSEVAYENWQSAEQALRSSMDSVSSVAERTFSTPFGNRVADAYNAASNVIGEAKYGAQALTQRIAEEVSKDAWLLQNSVVKEVQWHFYESAISRTIGATGPLFKALAEAGIKAIVHLQ